VRETPPVHGTPPVQRVISSSGTARGVREGSFESSGECQMVYRVAALEMGLGGDGGWKSILATDLKNSPSPWRCSGT
jgi:hypothetical protein